MNQSSATCWKQEMYFSSIARDGLQDWDVPIIYRGAQLINQPENKLTILRTKAVYAFGFSLNSATGNKELTDLGLQKHIGEATLGCFLQFCQTLAFLGHSQFSPAVTASVDDDKQQNDRYKHTSEEMLGIALDITFILSALIVLLKSYIIFLLCRDIRKIHLILLSRLRSWTNIDHWAH